MPASAKAIDLTAWLSKAEAADALRTSIKTIERMAARGELRHASRLRRGRKPEPVFDPQQIEGIMRQRELQPLALGDGMTPRLLLPASPAFAGAASAAAAARWLTLEQAAQHTGLSAGLLRKVITGRGPDLGAVIRAVRDGRRWKLRREDLDKL
ncbi:MAG TPA: hypothetical protein VE338_06815 [Ktedonobacterales bacterium]|nr:hypothetical protein [Ktedonobacterales bacterium]